MDEDELTKQRALDAAAAVAVAAAAAAQQTREAANAAAAEVQYRHEEEPQQQQQQQQLQQSEDDAVAKEDNDSSMNDVNGFTQHLDQGDEELQEESTVGAGVIRKYDESADDVGDSFAASTSASDQREADDEAVTLADGKLKRAKKPTVHHTKRRKINTCIPCKRRKVKCDREKPYCGQCQRHNFPPSECTWSAFAADIPSSKSIETPGLAAASTVTTSTSNGLSEPAPVSESGGSTTATQWLDMSSAPWASFTSISAEQTIQTLQNRVAELEAALEALRNEKSEGVSAEQETSTG